MNPQLNVILPIPIIEEIIFFCSYSSKLTFRVTCKRFLYFTTEHFFSTFTTTLHANTRRYGDEECNYVNFFNPAFGVLNASSTILFISDMYNDVIRKIDLSTNQVTTLCGSPKKRGWNDGKGTEVLFYFPMGLALHEKENLLYVSDSWNNVIRSVNLVDGQVNTIIGNQAEKGRKDGIGKDSALNYPCGLALDSISNLLYVADFENYSIRKILLKEKRIETLCGNKSELWGKYKDGSFEEATFCYPYDIALNLEMQELYVSDCYNHVIRVISLNNRIVSTLCGTPKIYGYVNGNATQAKFTFPRGVEFNSHSQCLYVSDENHTIRKISLTDKGRVDTLCGTAEMRGNENGFFPTFSDPKGIAFDSHSHALYIMDSRNNKVRKILDKKSLFFKE